MATRISRAPSWRSTSHPAVAASTMASGLEMWPCSKLSESVSKGTSHEQGGHREHGPGRG